MRAPWAIHPAGGHSLLALAFILALAPALRASDRFYLGPTGGPWTLPTSWNSKSDGSGAMGLPAEGDILFLKRDTSLTVNFNLPYTSPQYAGLYLDGVGTADVVLSQTSDSISTDFEVVGEFGPGQLKISGGAHNAGAQLMLAANPLGIGNITLSGSGALTAVDQIVGYRGHGSFQQFGGSNTVSGTLYIASEPGSAGSYDHEGGTLTAPNVVNNGLFTQAGGPATLGPLGGRGELDVNAGTSLTVGSLRQGRVVVGGTITLSSGGISSVIDRLTIATLVDGSTGGIDIKNNTLIVRDGSLATIRNQIKTGLAGPHGIFSTSTVGGATVGAILNKNPSGGPLYSSYGGVSGLLETDILVRYFYKGDLNFDGCVTIGDFIDASSNFNQPADWSKGDGNYDDMNTIADIIDLSSNFNRCMGPTPIAASSIAAVPEPTALLLLAAPLMIARKKRRPVLAVTPVS
jgi:hypothetical protein